MGEVRWVLLSNTFLDSRSVIATQPRRVMAPRTLYVFRSNEFPFSLDVCHGSLRLTSPGLVRLILIELAVNSGES